MVDFPPFLTAQLVLPSDLSCSSSTSADISHDKISTLRYKEEDIFSIKVFQRQILQVKRASGITATTEEQVKGTYHISPQQQQAMESNYRLASLH